MQVCLIHYEQHRCVSEQRDRLEIRDYIVLERIDDAVCDVRVPEAGDESVSVGRRMGDAAGPDAAVCARGVLDDDRLTKACLHTVGDDARDNIGYGPRRKRYDHRDSPRWTGLCPREV